jgi:hypothetical protein
VTPATEDVAHKHRLMLVGWTTDTEDWRGGRPDEMLARVEGGLRTNAIVLMHDGVGPGATRDGCAVTVDVINLLVSMARTRGLEPGRCTNCAVPCPTGTPTIRSLGPAWNGVAMCESSLPVGKKLR